MTRPSFPRLRILLIAELCNPEWISVPLEGWSHGRAIARLADVHLVTHSRNRDNIRRAGLVEGSEFTAIDATTGEAALKVAARLLGAHPDRSQGWTTLTALSGVAYYAFEAELWRRFGRAIRGGAYDVIHRLTPLSPTIPSLLAKQCRRAGVPFVLGPLNGGLPWPKEFGHLRIREREWLSYVRATYRLLPGYSATRECASAIIVGSGATRADLPDRYQSKTVYIPENAIDPALFARHSEASTQVPLRVAFVGRLVPYKCADIVIEAAAPLLRRRELHLEIVGDGPELPSLRALAERLEVRDQVRFPGWIPHRQLQDHLANFHAFAFPSVREFGGAVVLEAMALGLIPIVMDYGGPGELISEATGFALAMNHRDEVVRRMREVFETLSANPSIMGSMRRRARERVLRHFTWARKAEQVLDVYRWVLNQRGKPDFGMPLSDGPERMSA